METIGLAAGNLYRNLTGRRAAMGKFSGFQVSGFATTRDGRSLIFIKRHATRGEERERAKRQVSGNELRLLPSVRFFF